MNPDKVEGQRVTSEYIIHILSLSLSYSPNPVLHPPPPNPPTLPSTTHTDLISKLPSLQRISVRAHVHIGGFRKR